MTEEDKRWTVEVAPVSEEFGPAIPLEHAIRAMATAIDAAMNAGASPSTQIRGLTFCDYTYNLTFKLTWRPGQIRRRRGSAKA